MFDLLGCVHGERGRSPEEMRAVLVANLAPGDFFEPDESYDYPPGPPIGVSYQPLTPVETGVS